MFDDQMPQKSGAVPGNLPISEPEDMFAGVKENANGVQPTDDTMASGEKIAPSPQITATPASALSAGALRPKATISAPLPASTPPMPEALKVLPSEEQTSSIKGPKFSRYLLVGALVVLVAALVIGGGWYLYGAFINTPSTLEQNINQVDVNAELPSSVTDTNVNGSNTESESTDQNVLFGEPVDSDGDGLDNARENELGTDSNLYDTDNDGLSDFDEVNTWKSDPKNPDTDGDTFADGAEVSNGYSPIGAGKIFELPTSTKQ